MSRTRNLNLYRSYLFLGLLVLFFLGDFMKMMLKIMEFPPINFPKYIKIIGGLLVIAYTLLFNLYQSQISKRLFGVLILLLISFFASNLLLHQDAPLENIKDNLDFFLKACFLPFFLIPFHNLNKEDVDKGLLVLKYIFWVNCICICLGIVFKIKAFQTYPFDYRFGYKGIFSRSTYASYFFIFMIMYYYFNWIYLKQKSALKYLIIAMILSFMLGTKRLYFFNILLFGFHFLYAKLYKSKTFAITLTMMIILCFVMKDNLMVFLNSIFSIDLWVEINDNNGFLSALTSLRSDLLMDYFNEIILQKWSISNYILGGGCFNLIRPEMDLIDLYLFFGIIGYLCFVYLYKQFIFNFKSSNKILWFYLIIIILLALNSSGIIFSAYFALLLIPFSAYFRFENKNVR